MDPIAIDEFFYDNFLVHVPPGPPPPSSKERDFRVSSSSAVLDSY